MTDWLLTGSWLSLELLCPEALSPSRSRLYVIHGRCVDWEPFRVKQVRKVGTEIKFKLYLAALSEVTGLVYRRLHAVLLEI